MLKKILNTVFVRVLNGVINLLIIIICSKYFGKEGVGTIGLIILAISIFGIINSLITSGLIYFTSRINNFKLFIIAYLWTLLSLGLFLLLSQFIHLVDDKYLFHTTILAVLFSLTAVNTRIIAGNQRIIRFNFLNLLNAVLIISSLFVLTYFLNKIHIESYLTALYIAYSITFLGSLLSVAKHLKKIDFKGLYSAFLQISKFGALSSFAGMLQQLNYRLSYFFIEHFIGRGALGRFTVGVQLSESTWIIGRSIAFIQYSRISNLNDKEKSKLITISLLKLSFVISFLIITVLSLIPEPIISAIFGKDFSGTQSIILSLSTGILALACSFLFSGYFSGNGKPQYNTYASGIGLLITSVLGFYLIPKLGLLGAGITTSLSYGTITLFQFIVFMGMSKAKFSDFLLRKDDFIFGKTIILNILKGKK